MTTTPAVLLLSQNGKQVLLLSTFSINPDAYQYSGEWNVGVFHGQGSYLYNNGDRYEGEWKNGQLHGYGTYTWSNGDKWFGRFRDDSIAGEEGLNVRTTADQTTFIGTWNKHEFWNGSEYNNRGELVGKYLDGIRKSLPRPRFKKGQLIRSRFKNGLQVRHWKFGLGSIISIRDQSCRPQAQVRFQSVGTKWLVLTHADLTIDKLTWDSLMD